MTRVEAINELTKFIPLATMGGCSPNDEKGGFGSAIDSALRELEFSQGELASAVVEENDIPAYLALLDYYTLKLLQNYLAPMVDLKATAGDGSVEKKRSQAYQMVQGLLAEAKEDVKAKGYLTSDFSLIYFNTNYLEPDAAEI